MLRHGPRACCPPPRHPSPPQIRAGLPVLPRQSTAFPHHRRAMLHAVPSFPALSAWRADSDHDLGVMLIEAWAYVLDITGFYDSLIAGRSYLGTALDDAIAAEIVALTGYRPRPAMVSRVKLALEAHGRDPVAAPAATGFRSQPFGDEMAQVFELPEAVKIWPQRNHWKLAPHRLTTFDGVLRFAPNTGPDVNAVVVASSANALHAARVSGVEVRAEADGERYRVVKLDPPLPTAFAGMPVGALKVQLLPLTAAHSPLDAQPVSSTSAILDALYPLVQTNSLCAIEVNSVLHARMLTAVTVHDHSQPVGSSGGSATIPLTRIGFASIGTVPAGAAIRIHILPRSAGQVLRPAETQISLDMIRGGGWLNDRAARLNGAPASGEAMALGQRLRGVFAPGTLDEGPEPRFVPDASASSGQLLETPVIVLGNIVEATRGETVSNEVLGSGNAQESGQRLKLKKKPLSWIENPASAVGRSPQITLRVDGIEWTYVDSVYGRRPAERVYRIDMSGDGTATIVGGDGEQGARFPSGANNIVATYRHGAGAAKPPPGSISQFARPAEGLSKVSQPLDAWGGADAETAAQMRELAPAASLTLGRAVSLADFEAMIRSHSGIVNAAVAYSWDQGRQDAVVTAWIIADSGDPSVTLADYLAARAVPGLAIRVMLATRLDVPVFDVAVQAKPAYAAEDVRRRVKAALFDPQKGLLAPRNVPVAAPLFRSRLLAAIHAVEGVLEVPSISLATGPMPKAISPGGGSWFDFLTHGQVL